MKDKVLRLKDGNIYYILDEVIDENRRFIFSVLCDYETVKNDYYILELVIDSGKLVAKSVADKKVLNNIKEIFLEKLEN